MFYILFEKRNVTFLEITNPYNYVVAISDQKLTGIKESKNMIIFVIQYD